MNLYDTMTLLGMVDALDRPVRFIFDRFFGNSVIPFDTEEIMFDKISSNRRIAAYVSPDVPGKAQALRGSVAQSFKPGYVKPKAPISPGAVIRRRPGEMIGGVMAPEDRFDRIVVQEMEDQDASIARREEFMAIEILRTGKVIVESEDFPRMVVDYNRPAGHTKALTSGDRWGESNIIPTENITAWAQEVHDNSGAHPNQVIMDPLAAGLFLKDDKLQKILDNRRQAGGEMQLMGAATGAQGVEAVRLGSVGQFEFWQYQQLYKEAGVTKKMMPDYTVLLGSVGIEGHATYGAIQDLEALRALTRFPKMWIEKDPSVAMLMTQAAPLPVPGRIEASMCITVR